MFTVYTETNRKEGVYGLLDLVNVFSNSNKSQDLKSKTFETFI